MSMMISADMVRLLRERFKAALVSALKQLVQEKHLYQSVVVPAVDCFVDATKGDERVRVPQASSYIFGPWLVEIDRPGSDALFLKAPDVKLFCRRCDRAEAFNLVSAKNALSWKEDAGKETQQAFLFEYQCQSCKGVPELFLIRRRGVRLTVEGRSPIEHVEIPKVIPKVVGQFFRNAIVAHQSGQTLAGLFLLRTFVEQWVRYITASPARDAERILDEYMARLSNEFNDRFPSLRTIYGNLSADLHAAKGSAELFERTCEQIIEHFDARRLFKMPTAPLTPPAGGERSVPEVSPREEESS